MPLGVGVPYGVPAGSIMGMPRPGIQIGVTGQIPTQGYPPGYQNYPPGFPPGFPPGYAPAQGQAAGDKRKL